MLSIRGFSHFLGMNFPPSTKLEEELCFECLVQPNNTNWIIGFLTTDRQYFCDLFNRPVLNLNSYETDWYIFEFILESKL